MRNFDLFFFRKHTFFTCARLPPVTNPPTLRTYVSPTSRFDVNEQKENTLRKAARGPPPPPWPSIAYKVPGSFPCVLYFSYVLYTFFFRSLSVRARPNGEQQRLKTKLKTNEQTSGVLVKTRMEYKRRIRVTNKSLN